MRYFQRRKGTRYDLVLDFMSRQSADLTSQAHKLLHVPDPERTKLWLKSLFVEETEMSLSLPSMWEFYERIFWRWVDTHPHLEKEEFSKVVAKTFRKCVAVEVSDSYRE